MTAIVISSQYGYANLTRFILLILAAYYIPLVVLGSIGIVYYGPVLFGAIFIAIAAAWLIREDKLRQAGNKSQPPTTLQRLRAQERIVGDFRKMREVKLD